MKRISCLILILLSTVAFAQTKINGIVTDGKQAMMGVSISIKNSYDGTTSNADGKFGFESSEQGEQILVATFIGFLPFEQKITLNKQTKTIEIKLKEKTNELKAVSITAGSFDAGDKKRATIFSALDIVTTAGSAGDVTGALKTLPGAQQIGNQEGLFVRGGEGRETQTYIDGLLVRNPYNSSVPDISQRGKFNPFLFKGTSFSSGGYSALYGQGLSSALILDTKDLPDNTETNLSLSSVGVGIGHNRLWDVQKTSMGISVGYFNLSPYYFLIKKNIEFTQTPINTNAEVNLRKRINKKGFIKFYANGNSSNLGIKRPDINDVNHLKSLFELKNNFTYTNLTYTGMLSEKWNINAGVSTSNNVDDIHFGMFFNDTSMSGATSNIQSKASLYQGRVLITKYTGVLSALRIGAEFQTVWEYSFFNNKAVGVSSKHEYNDNYSSIFFEDEIYVNNKFVIKPGLRFENSSILSKSNVAPRFSMAYRTGRNSQVSFAYGDFYQKPDRRYLLYNPKLNFEKATHFVLNYQKVANDRTIRLEAFYKKYESLMLTPLTSGAIINTTSGVYAQNFSSTNIGNGGRGYANGAEFFLRDKKTIKNCDYWISYSLLDTKRKFSYYPDLVQPDFAATHTLNLVFKQFFPKLMLGYGITYNWASGRPYYNPNQPISNFMSDRTQAYNALGINANYLTHIGKAFTVLVLGVSNALGNQQVFGYRYSTNGQNREAIGLTASRFVFVGCFMNWGVDRRQQQVDDNLK
jgi:outer membrane receptor for ferrienterochelin and colicin